MSELKKREDVSKYFNMSTEELQEILRKHAHGELETEPDTEELFKIMGVLADRRQQTSEQVFHSEEEALAEFREFYMPKENEKKVRTLRFPVRVMKAAAAVLVITVVAVAGVSATAKAHNINIGEKFACWTQEFFHFTDGTNSTQETTPSKEENVEMESLQAALNQHMIDEKLVPTWLPEGYANKNMQVVDSPRERTFYAVYDNNETELIIKIRQVIGTQANQIEKNNDLLEVYVVDGVEYYIFSNTETLQAAWVIGEFECIIIGQITLEEMKMMINSI